MLDIKWGGVGVISLYRAVAMHAMCSMGQTCAQQLRWRLHRRLKGNVVGCWDASANAVCVVCRNRPAELGCVLRGSTQATNKHT